MTNKNTTMSEPVVIQEIEEYEYYEEEILSYCGLSTIVEGDNESCSSRQSDSSSQKGPRTTKTEASITQRLPAIESSAWLPVQNQQIPFCDRADAPTD